MRRIVSWLGLFLLLTLSFTGCFQETKTKLTLINNCGAHLELVKWRHYYFTNGEVWDAVLGKYCDALLNGTSVTREVTPGTDYIWFYLVNDNYKYRTANLVTVNHGKHLIVEFPPNFLTSSGQISKQMDSEGMKAQQLLEMKQTTAK